MLSLRDLIAVDPLLRLEADIVFTRKDGEDTVKEVKKLRGELEREKYTSATAQQKVPPSIFLLTLPFVVAGASL